ncbi:unnamed protein product [Brassica oleracea]|uniref:(rape) hypothetical protein n=1 Tax=Brassica napus TaxID=3708 RepID=A0A816IA68_BRANA|nr:unnamed protein product [Brassica napus]
METSDSRDLYNFVRASSAKQSCHRTQTLFGASRRSQEEAADLARKATHPKGRKMLTKYVELLLAVFRHLRFLFGGLRLDANLANQLRLTGFRFWKQLGKGVNSLYLTHKTLF